jgi:DNA-binding transcriptional regulator YiaG
MLKNNTNSPTPSPERRQLLKDLRKRYGLTQPQVASITYSKLRSVQQWEAGNRNMPDLKWHILTEHVKTIPEVAA